MIREERSPCLRGWFARSPQILTDSRWRHFDSQLEELAMDSRCSPQPIGSTHPSNQVANRHSHRRSPWPSPRLPRPIASERTPMPADDCVGLQDAEPAPPLRPYPRPQNPEEPVRLLEAQTPRRAELKHGDLVAKSRNLGLGGRMGSKRGGKECEQCDENGTHPETDDLINWCNSRVSSSDEVFGNHSL